MNFNAIVAFITKLSKRERLIFYAAIGVVSLVLIDKFVLSPILGRIRVLTDVIRQQEEEIRQGTVIIAEKDRIEEESETYRSYLSQAKSEETAITEFLKEVENIAKQSSVYLVDMKPTTKSQDTVSTKYFMRLNFEAQMEQVMNFFYYITIYKQLLKIEEFTLRPKTEGSSVISCDMSVSKAIVTE